MSIEQREFFLQLVRLGIGCEAVSSSRFQVSGPQSVGDWQALEELANEHGLLGVMLDGVEKLPRELRPEKKAILQSIGQLIQSEKRYAVQEHAAAEMALLLHQHDIRTYVLKGAVLAECYPRPEHRRSVDMDCFLTAHTESADTTETTLGSEDVWERGNWVLEEQGFEVRRDFYKNSTVVLPGLTVENHRYLTPFRGNRTLCRLEILLQSQLKDDSLKFIDSAEVDSRRFEETWLYRPPVMVSALFLIEHAYSHFLHEGLTWRLILDWHMFCRRHRDEIDWKALEARVDEFGFRRFYDTFNVIGQEAFGSRIGELENSSSNFSRTTDSKQSTIDNKLKSKMLEDVWAPLDVHETVTGLRGKLALTGNIWRARWKYRLFSDITWLQALWIQAKGVLFENNPKI